PDPAVGARRWGALAQFAVERGWGMDVLALDPHQLPRRDPAGRTGLPPEVRVQAIAQPRLAIEGVERVFWSGVRMIRRRVLLRRSAAVATPSLPRAGSLRRPEMRWWPLRLRTLARAYFAWLEHASTG